MEDAYVLQLTGARFKDLYLCFCGMSKCEPNHSFGPAVRPNYIIHYILSGKGTYQVEDQKYELQGGQGFLIEPEAVTDLPIEGVAMSCGYGDALVYSKAFKKVIGMPPSEYRKTHRQKVRENLRAGKHKIDTMMETF